MLYITRALQALYAKKFEEALHYCAEARRRDLADQEHFALRLVRRVGQDCQESTYRTDR